MGEYLEKGKALKVDQGMALPILLLTLIGWGVLVAALMQKDEEAKKNGIIMAVICMLVPFIGMLLQLYVGFCIYSNSK